MADEHWWLVTAGLGGLGVCLTAVGSCFGYIRSVSAKLHGRIDNKVNPQINEAFSAISKIREEFAKREDVRTDIEAVREDIKQFSEELRADVRYIREKLDRIAENKR